MINSILENMGKQVLKHFGNKAIMLKDIVKKKQLVPGVVLINGLWLFVPHEDKIMFSKISSCSKVDADYDIQIDWTKQLDLNSDFIKIIEDEVNSNSCI